MSKGFEKFGEVDGGHGGEFVRLSTYGQICVSQDALTNLFEGKRDVELFFDRERMAIGLKPCNESTSDSYRIAGSGNGISATAFFNHYGLNEFLDARYPVKKEDEFVVVELLTG